MPRAHPVTGLLVAAGAGRRMGRPKALMATADGEPWLRLALAALLPVTADVIVVLGCRAAEARTLLPADPRVTPVVAADWADGMGASLRAGLTHLLHEKDTGRVAAAALVHLVDLPDVTAEVAGRVVAAADPCALSAAAVRATYRGRPGHPVLLGRDHWRPLVAELTGDTGARDYLARAGVLGVDCTDLASGADWDTPTASPG